MGLNADVGRDLIADGDLRLQLPVFPLQILDLPHELGTDLGELLILERLQLPPCALHDVEDGLPTVMQGPNERGLKLPRVLQEPVPLLLDPTAQATLMGKLLPSALDPSVR
eukprot:CAMPEP_0115745678 /NCGR_PEP_ID=MMETSP0272-20121206/92243_1 /TAXON_ID=71861 /ORGANISM="Scrippsiella trochoidea, Strain CCMP3099" /LENGTH=110 /DNA_ID=CAMNT_0003190591 /DNA_START=120 /DNA_END=449 /DNA_ORIENTATION=-